MSINGRNHRAVGLVHDGRESRRFFIVQGSGRGEVQPENGVLLFHVRVIPVDHPHVIAHIHKLHQVAFDGLVELDLGKVSTCSVEVFVRPETISWTMFALAIILAVPLERFGAELPWGMPLVGQACICAAAITALEFVTGLVLNVWLGLGVWDYSHLAGNILGQICPQFTLLWLVLSVVGIVILDWMRYAVEGGEKPRYT